MNNGSVIWKGLNNSPLEVLSFGFCFFFETNYVAYLLHIFILKLVIKLLHVDYSI